MPTFPSVQAATMSFLAPLVPTYQQSAQSRRPPLPPLPAAASYPPHSYNLVGTEYIYQRPHTASSSASSSERTTNLPSLSSSSSVPDLKAYALASGPSSSLCDCPSSSQSTFERPHTATGSTWRASRPLPKVPHKPSASVSSMPPPHSSNSCSFRRPLPTPPSASPQQSAFLPPPALAPPATRELTPVPPPTREPTPVPPSTPTSAATRSTGSHNTRPLPKPVLRLLPDKAFLLSPVPALPSGASAGAVGMAPISYLRVNIPGSALGVAEFVLESPMCPPSPILFNTMSPGSALSLAKDDTVARRLSTMGFVEVGVSQTSSSAAEKRRGAFRWGASTEQVPVLAPPDDSASDETGSSSTCENEDEAHPAHKRSCHDIEITVEYIPPSTNTATPALGTNAKRISRRWIREKKGKRWVEDDYNQILEALRRL